MTLRKIVLFLLVLLAVLSCGDAGVRRAVERAEGLMESSPSEAFAVLDSVRPQAMQTGIGQRSRYILLRQMARHKMWEPIEVDSALIEAVAYADQNGRPNERLRANYLLGYGYAENNLVLEAQEAYFRAIESADTTARDCDFSRLSKTYAQKVNLYLNRTEYELMLEDAHKAKHFALLAGDSTLILSADNLIAFVLDKMGEHEAALEMFRRVFRCYREKGDSVWAGATARQIAKEFVYLEELDSVENYFGLYERDFVGPGGERKSDMRKGYYSLKGMYHEARENIDSALYYYKKSYAEGGLSQKIGACMRQSELFRKQNRTDSAYHYLTAYSQLREEHDKADRKSQLQNLHVRFDFDKVSARLLEKEKAVSILVFALISLILFVVLIVASLKSRSLRHKLENERLYSQLALLKSQIVSQQTANLSMEKAEEKDWESKFHDSVKTELHLKLTVLLENRKSLDDGTAKDLYSYCLRQFPEQYDLVMLGKLSPNEIKVCFLCLLGFKPVEIAQLISISKAGVTNIRSRLCKKLFPQTPDASATSFDDLLRGYTKKRPLGEKE